MYWPLGAPRVYASPQRRSTQSASHGDDAEKKDASSDKGDALQGLSMSRNGYLFATITSTTLNIWQTSPVVLLTSVDRSASSLESYGTNVAVLLRPDSSIVAVQTSLSFLITYQIHLDPESRVYRQVRVDEKNKRLSIATRPVTDSSRLGQREVHIRFRMVIKIDAGIVKALALDDELIVATEKPAAIQCIRWAQDGAGTRTSTEVLSRVPWLKKSNVTDVVYNRAMNLYVWTSGDGCAYAVQKLADGTPRAGHGKIFKGYPLHTPSTPDKAATKAAINARFSQLAIGCANGQVHVYTAKDYAGSLPISHKCIAPYSLDATGPLTNLTYSPDGYCLLAGYEKGWILWSVYGKLGGSSFTSDVDLSRANDEGWLMGISSATWTEHGTRIMFNGQDDDRLWVLDLAKSAMTGCFVPSNISRMLLFTHSSLMVYRGHDSSDMTSLSSDVALWNTVPIPTTFLERQAPIRSAVISPDGRYVAVAGRRGLAHFSVQSGRWKTFDNLDEEESFAVRGGMFWYQHILFVAVESEGHNELRLYSREMPLNESKVVFIEPLPAPAVTITPSGDDSLLIYTYENNLYHYVINTVGSTLEIVQVGAIGLHGIVRAPTRVRAVTWYLPEHQLLDGDPSQDVMTASVIFLVDAKLVLLQPTKDDKGELRFDMKIIANDVEFFSFTRDQVPSRDAMRLTPASDTESPSGTRTKPAIGLVDSLWYFDGQQIQVWPDVQEVMTAATSGGSTGPPQPVPIHVDFYPCCIALPKGVIVGLEPDLVQRRDLPFALFRVSIRTHLFLPAILRYYLSVGDATSALSLCHHYGNLPYFPHALEMLLHTVLDDEVDSKPPPNKALLPGVLSFLSSFPSYLDVVVQCTRKTELRSWRTLFASLPPPRGLFAEALRKGQLKTAGGYLLVLHTLEEDEDAGGDEAVDLLRRSRQAGEWDLCKEIARFLMALDPGGEVLSQAMQKLDIEPSPTSVTGAISPFDPTGSNGVTQLRLPRMRETGGDQHQPSPLANTESERGSELDMASSPGASEDSHSHYEGARDYFSRPSSSPVGE